LQIQKVGMILLFALSSSVDLEVEVSITSIITVP